MSNKYVTKLSQVLVTDPALAADYFWPALREQAEQRADGSPSVPTPVQALSPVCSSATFRDFPIRWYIGLLSPPLYWLSGDGGGGERVMALTL